jgi:hypothetical protein
VTLLRDHLVLAECAYVPSRHSVLWLTMDTTGSVVLAPESSTLTPLPPVLRQGLAGVAVLACISFAASTSIFLYLTCKLIAWSLRVNWQRTEPEADSSAPSDPRLGYDERDYAHAPNNSNNDGSGARRRIAKKLRHPNQFLVLVYNLFLADIHQAGAFLLNAVWINYDGIYVGTGTCFAQGWLVSTGDLASSCFILLIAIHTYASVVWDYRFPHWAVTLAVIGAWAFVYLLAIAGVAATQNGDPVGGFYVRAAAWVREHQPTTSCRLLSLNKTS